jgi:BlaI family transcriptional regulator, penicillinase repressor
MDPQPVNLSRRERQVMDILFRIGEAPVSQVLSEMNDAPSYSAVRALMNVLVRKGHLRYRRDGLRYVYRPTRPRTQAARSALKRTVATFFEGSPEKAVAALLDMSAIEMSGDELDRIERMIRQAKEGRK